MKRFAALRRFLFGFPKGSLEAWLASDDPAEQALADKTLRQMGEENALTFLLATIEGEEKRRRRRGWCNAALIWVGSWFGMFVAALAGFRHHMVLMTLENTAMCFGLIAFLLGGTPSRLHRQCVERLAALDDRHAFPALVAALVNPYQIQINVVARRLIRMLPEMETADFAALSQAHQQRFFNCINPRFGSVNKKANTLLRRELARAVLLAAARLGLVDSEALRATRIVANAKSKAGNDILQRTAQNCLPLLEKARAEQKKAAEQKVVVRR